ncbi:uncharacterized protein [Palaemon carinicauda]|uniref:uncharacterized protein n=1 Tax=Palaemon carinicauda TaxID=392227 RepID=UPI0035B62A34
MPLMSSVSDRAMSSNSENECVVLNVISAYAPQSGCKTKAMEEIWIGLDELMGGIPSEKRVMIWTNFNGHVGEGNVGDEVMGICGLGERNAEEQMVTNFFKRMDTRINKSGGRYSDYIMCMRCNLKEVRDMKWWSGTVLHNSIKQ